MRRFVVLGMAWACGTDISGPPVLLVPVDPTVSGVVAAPLSLRIRALDAEDRPVPGVTLRVQPIHGQVPEPLAPTDDDGVAAFVWIPGTVAGAQQLDISVAEGDLSERFTIVIQPGPPATGHFTESSIVVTGAQVAVFPVEARDAFGNLHPDPPLAGSPGTAVADSARWKATILGRVRFTLELPGNDSLDVYVHPPEGAYRVQFRMGDTLAVETGRFVPSAADPATLCTLPSVVRSVRVFDAANVRRIRTASGGFADTLDVALRVGALVHVMEPGLPTAETQVVRFQAEGRPAPTTCGGTFFVRAWNFALGGALQDSLVITPG